MSIVPKPQAVLPDAVLNEQLMLLAQTDDINQGTLDKIREEGAKIFAQYPVFFKTTFEPLLTELQKKAAAGEKLDNSDKAHIANLQDRVGALTRILLFPNNVEMDAKQAHIEIDWMKVAKEISTKIAIPEKDIAILQGQDKFPAGDQSNKIVSVVYALATSGHLKEALAYVRKLSDEYDQAQAIYTIADALTIENYAQISEIARAIPIEGWRAMTLNRVAAFLIRSEQLEKAMTFMRQEPKKIYDEDYITTLKALINALMNKGKFKDIEQFKQSLPEQEQAIIAHMVNNRNKLLGLAKAGVMKNEIETALTKSGYAQDQAFGQITSALMAQGKLEEAAVAAMSIINRDQVVVVSNLVEELIKQEDFVLAETVALTIIHISDFGIPDAFLKKEQYQTAVRIALKIYPTDVREETLMRLALNTNFLYTRPKEIYRIALHIQNEEKHDSVLKAGIDFLKTINVRAAIPFAAALKDKKTRLSILSQIAASFLGPKTASAIALLQSYDPPEQIIQHMLESGAPAKEIFDWMDDRLITQNVIRDIVYRGDVSKSEFEVKIKHLRETGRDDLADMINAEFTRASAIRDGVFKEFLSDFNVETFSVAEPAGTIKGLRDIMGAFAFSYEEMLPLLSKSQREGLINQCYAKDPIKPGKKATPYHTAMPEFFK